MDSTFLRGVLTLIFIFGVLLFSIKTGWGSKETPSGKSAE